MSCAEQHSEKELDIASYDVARFLLQERYLLTALEFHAELVEAGDELPCLRDYFSNPANFDLLSKPSGEVTANNSNLNRSSSQTTLDSLEWARYSEDGERIIDDRVAVLEFELRKAKETIQGLRNNLTQATSSIDEDSSADSKNKSTHDFNIKELKPHQSRTLNFLINEYLSMMGYKMTAITFADETDNQDFENWDDVGLNIPRPSSLPQCIFEKKDFALTSCIACQTEEDFARDYQEEIIQLKEKIYYLEALHQRQETELQKIERRMSTPHMTPIGTPLKECSDKLDPKLQQEDLNIKLSLHDESASYIKVGDSGNELEETFDNDFSVITEMSNLAICDNQKHSDIEGLNNTDPLQVNVESLEDILESPCANQMTNDDLEGMAPEAFVDSFPQEQTKSIIADDSVAKERLIPGEGPEDPQSESVGDELDSAIQDDPDLMSESSDMLDPRKCDRLPPLGACNDWNPQGLLAGEFITAQQEEAKNLLTSSSSRHVPEYLEKHLLSACLGCTLGVDSRLQTEVASLSLGHCDLLNLVSSSLHNIAPNVILSKREELLPLLVYCISQHSESSEREKLLHLLFNLTKRPDKDQRSTILIGLVSLARVLRPEKLEAELLPQCWEQLTHKYPERRLLVAQSVAVLAPYTPPPLRNSLLMSMLQQILSSEGEKDTPVIDAAMASLALLITYLEDVDKINSLFNVVFRCLENGDWTFNPIVSSALPQSGSSILLLLLSVFQWGLEDSFLSQFVESAFVRLKSLLLSLQKERAEGRKGSHTDKLTHSTVSLIKALNLSCPYLMIMLFKSLQDCDDEFDGDSLASSPSAFAIIGELSVILENRDKAEECLNTVYHYISTGKTDWPELDFIVKSFISPSLECISLVEADMKEEIKGFVDLVWRLQDCFGPHIKTKCISPMFLDKLTVDEKALERIRNDMTPLTKAPLIVYAIGVLAGEDHKSDSVVLSDFMSRQISILALCGAPNTALQMTILLLLEKTNSEEAILGALWSCIVHRSTLVRAGSAPLWGLLVGHVKEAELSSRVIPALVTLATDPEVSVKAASLAPLTAIIANAPSKEVCDKVWLQLESICEETNVIESSTLQIAIAQTCSFFGHNTPANLLHSMYLPCLCRASLEGKGTPQDKIKFGVSLLEAFTALSSSAIPNHLVAHFILPPLNQLQKTLGAMSYEHMETITLLTKEYTLRAQAAVTSSERSRGSFSSGSLSSLSHSISSSVGSMGAGLPIGTGVEDVKNKMSKMFSSGKAMSTGLQAKAPNINIQSIFKKK